MNRHELAQKIAVYFIRDARGQALFVRVSDPIRDILDGTVYMLALKGLFGVEITLSLLVGIVIIKKILHQVFAWLDEKFIGFWKAENYFNEYELSPYNKELLERVKRIEQKFDDNCV